MGNSDNKTGNRWRVSYLKKIAVFGSAYRGSCAGAAEGGDLLIFAVAHPMKQAHRVKIMRQRFIVADLRFIK
ncbi:hypothetical protein QZR14_23095 [Pseudomonas sp. rhizo66]|nr:hypothetical protein [Pseudomonas sp. AKS31]MDT3314259.1 hypothetical protein [Pseudomonas sp. rhizo66]